MCGKTRHNDCGRRSLTDGIRTGQLLQIISEPKLLGELEKRPASDVIQSEVNINQLTGKHSINLLGSRVLLQSTYI